MCVSVWMLPAREHLLERHLPGGCLPGARTGCIPLGKYTPGRYFQGGLGGPQGSSEALASSPQDYLGGLPLSGASPRLQTRATKCVLQQLYWQMQFSSQLDCQKLHFEVCL